MCGVLDCVAADGAVVVLLGLVGVLLDIVLGRVASVLHHVVPHHVLLVAEDVLALGALPALGLHQRLLRLLINFLGYCFIYFSVVDALHVGCLLGWKAVLI